MADMTIEPSRGKVILTTSEHDRGNVRQAWGELLGIKYSPLSRKIVTFNLVALCLMMTGILYLNQFDDGLIEVREDALETDARFVSEALSFATEPVADGDTLKQETVMLFKQMTENGDTYAQLFDPSGRLVAFSFAGLDRLGAEALDQTTEAVGPVGLLELIGNV